MSLETFVLKCPKCGNTMNLYDDDIEEPTWQCSRCGMEAWGEDGEINFVDPDGDGGYTYDEVYGYLD